MKQTWKLINKDTGITIEFDKKLFDEGKLKDTCERLLSLNRDDSYYIEYKQNNRVEYHKMSDYFSC